MQWVKVMAEGELREGAREIVTVAGRDLLLIKQKHLGSDRLPNYIANMEQRIRSNGVTIHTSEEVKDVIVEKGGDGELALAPPVVEAVVAVLHLIDDVAFPVA